MDHVDRVLVKWLIGGCQPGVNSKETHTDVKRSHTNDVDVGEWTNNKLQMLMIATTMLQCVIIFFFADGAAKPSVGHQQVVC